MSLPKRLENYLKKSKVKYAVIPHKVVYTSYDLATTLKEKLEKVAKTLLVKADKRFVLVVVPGNRRLDLNKIKKTLKAKVVTLAPEKVMAKVLKVKPGALTPFGGYHKLEMLMDKGLVKAKEVLAGTGSFTESLRVKVKDLHKVEGATVADVVEKAALKVAKAAKRVARKVKSR